MYKIGKKMYVRAEYVTTITADISYKLTVQFKFICACQNNVVYATPARAISCLQRTS